MDIKPLRTRPPSYLETSGTNSTVTRQHKPENRSPQMHHCQSQIPRKFRGRVQIFAIYKSRQCIFPSLPFLSRLSSDSKRIVQSQYQLFSFSGLSHTSRNYSLSIDRINFEGKMTYKTCTNHNTLSRKHDSSSNTPACSPSGGYVVYFRREFFSNL
jgi:hypothetical protein